jgi:hypothetical protein
MVLPLLSVAVKSGAGWSICGAAPGRRDEDPYHAQQQRNNRRHGSDSGAAVVAARPCGIGFQWDRRIRTHARAPIAFSGSLRLVRQPHQWFPGAFRRESLEYAPLPKIE